MKPIHKLPMSFEVPVKLIYDSRTGKPKYFEIAIRLVCDGRIDIKPDQRVKVTIERYKVPS